MKLFIRNRAAVIKVKTLQIQNIIMPRLTCPKGLHSYRYFLCANPFVVCSCMYSSLLQNRSECIHHGVKCMYAWADNRRICIDEQLPEWVNVFWVCKLMNDMYNCGKQSYCSRSWTCKVATIGENHTVICEVRVIFFGIYSSCLFVPKSLKS